MYTYDFDLYTNATQKKILQYTIDYSRLDKHQLRSNVIKMSLHVTKCNIYVFQGLGDMWYSIAGFNIHVKQRNNWNLSNKIEKVCLQLTRRISPYLLNLYLPTGILVAISFISFFIPTDLGKH